jgi:TonB-linked SusC/RagA family outer membrane protein
MFSMKKISIVLMFLFICVAGPGQLMAQTKVVRGTVISGDDKQSLPGVNVSIKGTTTGVVTDINGQYSITVSSKDVLVFSFIGYKTVEIAVGGQTEINTTLVPGSVALDELVVVGYGNKKKSDLIGSVSSVKAAELVGTPTSDLQGMLKGQVAGLNVSVSSAAPGGSSTVLLRGINSLKGGTEPLYVVDGFPVASVNEINVNDVETVSVLKDASAQGIYGARASNGVILITTKRGENTRGKSQVSYNGYIGIQNVKTNLKLYSPEEYIQLRREAFRGDNASAANGWIGTYKPDEDIFTPIELENIKNGEFVDWLDEAFNKNALVTKHDISVTGGNDNTKYAASMGVFYQDGVRLVSDYTRYSAKLALDQKLSSWFNVGASIYYSQYLQNRETTTLTDFITFPPIARLYDTSGELNLYPLGDFKSVNPLWWSQTRESSYHGNRGLYNGYLEVTPSFLSGLKYRFNANYDNSSREANDFMALNDPSNYLGKGYANVTFLNIWKYDIENILTYETRFKEKHRMDVTLMQSAFKQSQTTTSSIATQLGNDFFGINSLGSALESSVGRGQQDRSMLSLMARINYILSDRYLFNFTIRADGSSVFGANNKWGYFPSVGFSWNMHKEKFMAEVAWMVESKLRLSVGQIGNEAIPPYGSLSTAENAFYVSNGTPVIGYLPGTTLPNPNLKWETSTTFNLGYDFSVLKSRLYGTLEFYNRITKNLLVNRLIPTSLGYSSIPDNLGEIQNQGFEASLNGFIISNHNLSWMVGGKFSINKNRLTKGVLVDEETGEYVDDVVNRWFIGQPVNVYYDYKFDGIWQIGDDIANSAQPNARPGDVRVANMNGDSIINADDRVVIKRDPDFIVSFTTAVKYKRLEFSADVYIVKGGTRSNPFMSEYNYGGSLQGYKNGIYREYWTPENPSTTCFRPHETVMSEYRGALDYQDASYIRITNLTLAYTLPDKWMKSIRIQRIKTYIRADNFFTFTKYKSFGPETDPNDYPQTADLTFGVNVNF